MWVVEFKQGHLAQLLGITIGVAGADDAILVHIDTGQRTTGVAILCQIDDAELASKLVSTEYIHGQILIVTHCCRAGWDGDLGTIRCNWYRCSRIIIWGCRSLSITTVLP